MGNVMDDYSAELSMIIGSYKKLQEKDPDHELLELMELHKDEQGMNFKNRFWDKCSREGFRQMHAYMTYHQFLKSALCGQSYRFFDHPVQIALDNLNDSLRIAELKLRRILDEEKAPSEKEILIDILKKTEAALNTDASQYEVTELFVNSVDNVFFSYIESDMITVPKDKKLLIDTIKETEEILRSDVTRDNIKKLLLEKIRDYS